MLAILLRLDFPPAAAFAFVIAAGFVADTTSLPLIISNLVNIVSANYFGVSFTRYAVVMVPVDVVSLVATMAVLGAYYARDIPAAYPLDALRSRRRRSATGSSSTRPFRCCALLILAYAVTGPLGVPVAFVTGAGALVLVAIAGRWGLRSEPVVPLMKVMREAPWQIVVFSIGMYLVVYGLGNAGLTGLAARLLVWLGGQGPLAATLGTGFAAAILASVMNNLPATLVGALAIDHAKVTPAIRELMVYANVVGNDLGPKFTPIGSLATLLWLHVLAGKGVRIGWAQYCRVGLVITPPVLAAALVALWLWLPLISG